MNQRELGDIEAVSWVWGECLVRLKLSRARREAPLSALPHYPL